MNIKSERNADKEQVLASSATNVFFELSEPATEGLKDLLSKLEPLLAGGRLSRIVDIASVAADVVDMSDAYMVEKLANVFEEVTAAAWMTGNAARVAGDRVGELKDPPSLMALLRMSSEPDVRRGIAFALSFAGALGRQLNHGIADHCED